MHRGCKRCGYLWTEEPLDSGPLSGVGR